MLILDRAGEQAVGQDPRGQGRYPIGAPEILGGQLFRVAGYPKHAAERFRPPGISASPASTRVTPACPQPDAGARVTTRLCQLGAGATRRLLSAAAGRIGS